MREAKGGGVREAQSRRRRKPRGLEESIQTSGAEILMLPTTQHWRAVPPRSYPKILPGGAGNTEKKLGRWAQDQKRGRSRVRKRK